MPSLMQTFSVDALLGHPGLTLFRADLQVALIAERLSSIEHRNRVSHCPGSCKYLAVPWRTAVKCAMHHQLSPTIW